jgi:hypothetical protein
MYVYICQLRQWHKYLIFNDSEFSRGQYLSRQPTQRIENSNNYPLYGPEL